MSDLDLAYYPPPLSLIGCGAQTEEMADAGELIITDQDNNMKGNASFLEDDYSLRYTPTQPYTMPSSTQALAKSTVRIIAEYKGHTTGVTHTYCGSGFFISPTIILTAWHVVEPETEVKTTTSKEPATLINLYFSSDINCQNLSKVKKKPVRALAPLSNKALKETYTIHVDTSVETKERSWQWSNDFAFLLTDTENKSDYYALPAHLGTKTGQGIVMSYPGYISKDDFIRKYASHHNKTTEQAKDLFIHVKDIFQNFGFKSMSWGTYEYNGPDILLYHKAPTLGGSSGGPISSFQAEGMDPTFFGVHVGGDLDMLNNLAVSVSRVSFKEEYVKILKEYAPQVLQKPIVQTYLKSFQ